MILNLPLDNTRLDGGPPGGTAWWMETAYLNYLNQLNKPFEEIIMIHDINLFVINVEKAENRHGSTKSKQWAKTLKESFEAFLSARCVLLI